MIAAATTRRRVFLEGVDPTVVRCLLSPANPFGSVCQKQVEATYKFGAVTHFATPKNCHIDSKQPVSKSVGVGNAEGVKYVRRGAIGCGSMFFFLVFPVCTGYSGSDED